MNASEAFWWLALPVFILACAIALFIGSFWIVDYGVDQVSALVFPRVLALCTAVTTGLALMHGLKGARALSGPVAPSAGECRALGVGGILLVVVAAMPYLGFYICVGAGAVAMMALTRAARWPVILAVTVGLLLSICVIFDWLLDIPLPGPTLFWGM